MMTLKVLVSVLGLSFALGTSAVVPAAPLRGAVQVASTPAVAPKFVDPVFDTIEDQQGSRPYGDILDAGTGMFSLQWLTSLLQQDKIKSFTAVTAEPAMRDRVQKEAERLGVAEGNSIVIGNWFGNIELPKKQYDTILAEYLIGAIDGFAPFKQQEMIPKLVALLKPGGRLYLVGWEPMPDKADGPAGVVCKVQRIKDACIMIAGQRPYREYPVEWVLQQVDRLPNAKLAAKTQQFPIRYQHQKIVSLINAGRKTLEHFPSQVLAASMADVLNDLERQSKDATDWCPTGTIEQGFDYLVTIEKIA
jgi:hypothetical protein